MEIVKKGLAEGLGTPTIRKEDKEMELRQVEELSDEVKDLTLQYWILEHLMNVYKL